MTASEHRRAGHSSAAVVVITVSDTRDLESDATGRLIEDRLAAAGHKVHRRIVVRDDICPIRDALLRAVTTDGVDVVILNGGTGVARRDVTLEAVGNLFHKRMPGFGELFRQLSFEEVGAAAMLSCAAAGTYGDRLVFALPGAPAAARLAPDRLIVPELAHLLHEVRK